MDLFTHYSPEVLTEKAKALFAEERQTKKVLNGWFLAKEIAADASQGLTLSEEEKATLELLPYHEYGKDKYKALSMDYTMTDAARISPSTVSEFTRIFTDAGIHVIRT